MFRQENNSKSYYDILKIAPDSSDAEVKKAYLDLAKIYHPDKNPGNRKIAALRFRLINEAYAAIKTQDGRGRYNRLLLLQQGKPKGMHLRADNDNRSVSNDIGLWSSFLNFFSPPKSIEPQKHSPQKDG